MTDNELGIDKHQLKQAAAELLREHGAKSSDLKSKLPDFCKALVSQAAILDDNPKRHKPNRREFRNTLNRISKSAHLLIGDLRSLNIDQHISISMLDKQYNEGLAKRVIPDLEILHRVAEAELKRKVKGGQKGHLTEGLFIEDLARVVFKATGKYPFLKHDQFNDIYVGPFIEVVKAIWPLDKDMPAEKGSTYKWIDRALKRAKNDVIVGTQLTDL